jgi:hypothetical protein
MGIVYNPRRFGEAGLPEDQRGHEYLRSRKSAAHQVISPQPARFAITVNSTQCPAFGKMFLVTEVAGRARSTDAPNSTIHPLRYLILFKWLKNAIVDFRSTIAVAFSVDDFYTINSISWQDRSSAGFILRSAMRRQILTDFLDIFKYLN